MESPLRFHYLVELNLDNVHTKRLNIAAVFKNSDLSYSLFGSKLYTQYDDCIAAIEQFTAEQITRLGGDDMIRSIAAHNSEFTKINVPHIDDESGIEFDPDELYKMAVYDAELDESIMTLTVLASDISTIECEHFSGEVH